ncbi:Peptidyl-tRNA hydrolase ArfB [Roseibaca ekhonensis]|uniref:Peptidyl-tRNA hydrolase ArfB n=2 Tax=Roseinatronobacter ekhonensis TaxID=254356 RepID=A0A3B0MN03_9RHOB|nr:Peptidyl-tRNA hydrolase ArfB [Roseibaca ekhonensis]
MGRPKFGRPFRLESENTMRVTDEITLQDWELTETFTRAQGPGGQNVNKVSSAVELRFEAARSPNLPDPVKARLRRLAGRRWTQDGALILRVEDTRSQVRNREIARTRLAELIRAALVAPKKRIATRPSLGAKRRRMDAKTRRGQIKALRAPPDGD